MCQSAKAGLQFLAARGLAALDAQAVVSLIAKANAKMSDAQLVKKLLNLERQLDIGIAERWVPTTPAYLLVLPELVEQQLAG